MKKQWKRVLASIMAIAMIVTLAPMQQAEAQGKTSAASGKKVAVVANQKQLKKALKDDAVTKIKLKTDAEKKFKVAEGDYTNKKLIVKAPNADVVNKGTFKKITIRSIKPSTWIEKAKGKSTKYDKL